MEISKLCNAEDFAQLQNYIALVPALATAASLCGISVQMMQLRVNQTGALKILGISRAAP
jgi:peroxiredoxin